jgi:type IV secretion system protein VirB4
MIVDTARIRRFLADTLRVPLRPADPRRGPHAGKKLSYPLADFSSTAESFADRLPYLLKIDPTTAVTRDLGYTRTFRMRGKDLALASLDIRNSLNDRINGAWKGTHDGWMWHTHLDRKKLTRWPINQTFPDTASWLVAEESRVAFEAGVHYASDVYWTVTYLAPSDKKKRGDNLIYDYAPGAGDVQSVSSYEARKTFEEGLSSILNALRKDFDFQPLGLRHVTGPHAVPYWVDDQLSFLMLCATGKRQDVRAIPDGAEISEYIADSLVQREERLRVGDVLVRPLTIVDFPDSSTPFILDVLDQLSGTFIPSWRWIGRDPQAALKEIKKRRGRSIQKRKGMTDSVVETPNALVDPEQSRMVNDATHAFGLARSGQVANGWFSFVVTAYEEITEDDRIAAELARRRGENVTAEMLASKRQDKLCDEIAGSLKTKGFVVSSELDNAMDSFLGSLPADGHDNVIRGQLNTRVLANWIPTTHVWQGEWRCTDPDLSPDLGPLAIFQTNGATPFALNLHYGKRGGNTLIVGEPGSGKTTLAGYLANRHRGYAGQQIIIDNEYQHWVHCVAVGGTHVEIMPTGEFGLAPFANLDEDDEFAWCQSFIKLLCSQVGYTDPSLAEIIYVALVTLRDGPRENRTMTGFLASFGVTNDMRLALAPFTRDGLAGNLFDTATQAFDASTFTVFEISTLGEDPTLRKPALIALMHTIQRMFKHYRPSMVITEELWELLEDPIATGIVLRWVKMIRRKGGVLVLLTQSIEDLDHAPKGLLNACVTKIILPNEGAIGDNAERFRAFGLEAWERHQLAALAGRNSPLIMQPGGRRFVDATLGPVALATVGQSSTAQIERAEQFMQELGEHWYPDFVEHHFRATTDDEKRIAESWRRHAYFGPERISDRKLFGAPAHAAPHPDDPFASQFDRETAAA